MNHVSWVFYYWSKCVEPHIHPRLDSIGIAGFSHDFGTLQGKHSIIAEVFDSLGKHKPTFFQIITFLLGPAFPILNRIPSPRRTLEKKFKLTADGISKDLLQRTRQEKEGAIEGKRDNSVIGTLSVFICYDCNTNYILHVYSQVFRRKLRAAYLRRRSHCSGELDSISPQTSWHTNLATVYTDQSPDSRWLWDYLKFVFHTDCYQLPLIKWLHRSLSTEVSLTVGLSIFEFPVHLKFRLSVYVSGPWSNYARTSRFKPHCAKNSPRTSATAATPRMTSWPTVYHTWTLWSTKFYECTHRYGIRYVSWGISLFSTLNETY